MRVLLMGVSVLSLVGALLIGAAFPPGGLLLGAFGLFILETTTRL